MFENNEFFNKQNHYQSKTDIEVKLPTVNSGILFGMISLISSAIGFAILFGGYSMLNISKEIANRPFANIKLMIFVALVMFSLSAIVFGIIGALHCFKKEKSGTANTVSAVLSVFGIILGITTVLMSFLFFFMGQPV